jgi:hypothetical protein
MCLATTLISPLDMLIGMSPIFITTFIILVVVTAILKFTWSRMRNIEREEDKLRELAQRLELNSKQA